MIRNKNNIYIASRNDNNNNSGAYWNLGRYVLTCASLQAAPLAASYTGTNNWKFPMHASCGRHGLRFDFEMTFPYIQLIILIFNNPLMVLTDVLTVLRLLWFD